MTPQATKCIELYRGGNPSTIRSLLDLQKASVVTELKEHFGTSDLDKLAIALSRGK